MMAASRGKDILEEFNTKLVDAVKRRPVLYDYSLSEYSRKDITELAWDEIAEEMCESGM